MCQKGVGSAKFVPQKNNTPETLITFHTESVGTAGLTRQIRMEKLVLIQTNKIPVQTS